MMKHKRCDIRLLFALIAFPFLAAAQPDSPVQGIPDPRSRFFAFTNATIQVTPQLRYENATLVIRDGRIIGIGKDLPAPLGSVVFDLNGKYICPSFIDLYAQYGLSMASPKESSSMRSGMGMVEELNAPRKGAFGWNDALKVDFQAGVVFHPDDKEAEPLRNAGFGTVLTHRMDGISRGTSALVTLGQDHPGTELIIKNAAHHLSFKKGNSSLSYPGSLMGCIALIRQTYLDGQWYKDNQEHKNFMLEAWNNVQGLPQLFDVRDWQEALRAQTIANEFKQRYILKGTGDEYQRIIDIKNTGAAFILPVNFPEPLKIETPYDLHYAPLTDMIHWEWAPANAAVLSENGIAFAFTANGLKKTDDFLPAVRKTLRYGLSEEYALAALTTIPAMMIHASHEIGTLEKGKKANFLICSAPILSQDAVIYANWINGKPYDIQPDKVPDLRGKYDLIAGSNLWKIHVRGSEKKQEIYIVIQDSIRHEINHRFIGDHLILQFNAPYDSTQQWFLSGTNQENQWVGTGIQPNGSGIVWQLIWTDTVTVQNRPERENKPINRQSLTAIPTPFLPYGWTAPPPKEPVIIQNTTLWTNESEGILENTDILLSNGKIGKIGKNLTFPGAKIIDGTGKHVTPGIIDEHSHIAISRGVNECTQENTGEVRIGDVINCQDINIYRQLSGGVTTAQLLHGSCNPIGGQSAIVKLRWGASPEDMKFAEAKGFIKFALGENVKRSNRPSNTRYPNTRMGVEQVYINAFTRAREYEAKKNDPAWRKKLRIDLELETLLEILSNQRFISCHSYVQSEINMLMKVAEQFGFKINTFTHILEGYKVADKLAKHGAGGSSFSDWWAYKFEVYDAIPYNGAILHREGVVTAFNSDDAEMGRRLNQEAAKAVLYGDVPEEEALKFVTLNPAKLLRIDHAVGSLRVGKDADIVIWSDHPLSIYAVADMTFVDGIPYFDRERDRLLRDQIHQTRLALMRKMKEEGGSRGRGMKPFSEHLYHCDTVEEEILD